MPRARRHYGARVEDDWTRELVEELHGLDMGARLKPNYHYYEAGRRHRSEPDIEITNGGISVGSAKVGEWQLHVAFSTAQEYQVKVQRSEELRVRRLHETYAIVYPKGKGESFHLYTLARQGRATVRIYSADTLHDLALKIQSIELGKEDTLREEPTGEEAPKLLFSAARALADTIKGASQTDLEEVFGGHHFFRNVLAAKLRKKAKRAETLRMGAAFLFVNQIFFYTLLSRAAEEQGEPKKYPAISEEHMGNPACLHNEYFEKVHKKNYEPIYGLHVARLFTSRAAEEACRDVVKAVVALAPKIDKRDLAGQVFQGLIPFDIRKPLGAHYTNPRPAELLAQLAIDKGDTRVIDPACGSGTLLVASYQRKAELEWKPGASREVLHKRFVEEEITGVDAMAFAAHLAAVNLALQEPLLETDHVRIAYRDSTSLKPGLDIEHTPATLFTSIKGTTLDHEFSAPPTRGTSKTVIAVKQGSERSFKIDQVDLVIMNPPFTRWSTMAPLYRSGMRKAFENERAEYRQAITKRPGQHLFFLLLADRLLKPGGRVACVLPQATFTEAAYQAFVGFFLRNYTIKHVVLGLGRASFSEDTSLTECLLVAEKRAPAPDSAFALIGTRKTPERWTSEEIRKLALRVNDGSTGRDEFAVIKQVPQTALGSGGETLTGLFLDLFSEYEDAFKEIRAIRDSTAIPLLPFAQVGRKAKADVERGIETAEHFSHYGSSALIACRAAQGLKKVDRLMFVENSDQEYSFRDRVSEKVYRVPASKVAPALRRLKTHTVMDVTDETDFCISEYDKVVDEVVEDLYGTKRAGKLVSRIRKRWSQRVRDSSARLLLFRRGNVAAPGTHLLCFRADRPMLQAGTNYLVKGFDDPAPEQLLCLWFNSTPFILQMLRQASITEGGFVTLEKFGVEKTWIPDPTSLTPAQKDLVGRVYHELKTVSFPSLLEQLENHDASRVALDDRVLQLLGVEDERRRRALVIKLQTGLAVPIRTLKESMGAGIQEDDEGAESE